MLVCVKFSLYELVFQKRHKQIGSKARASSSSGVSIDSGIDTGETKPFYTSWGLSIFFFKIQGTFHRKGFVLTLFNQLYSWSEIEISSARSLQKWDKYADDEEVLIIVYF